MRKVQLMILILLTCDLAGLAWADAIQPRLYMDWPTGWEYQSPVARGAITYFQARQSKEGSTVQQLKIRLIPLSSTAQPVDAQSLHDLVVRLRAATSRVPASVQDVQRLSTAGYYFSLGKYESGVDVRHVEGVLMRDGYFLQFTLSTKGADPSEILVALGSISIR